MRRAYVSYGFALLTYHDLNYNMCWIIFFVFRKVHFSKYHLRTRATLKSFFYALILLHSYFVLSVNLEPFFNKDLVSCSRWKSTNLTQYMSVPTILTNLTQNLSHDPAVAIEPTNVYRIFYHLSFRCVCCNCNFLNL